MNKIVHYRKHSRAVQALLTGVFLGVFMTAFFVANAQQLDPEGTVNTIESAYDNPDGNIPICHWDDEEELFVSHSPNLSSIINGTGHGGHGEDIIPPFWHQVDDQDPQLYSGNNWNPDNQILWDNDCTFDGSISGTKFDDSDNDGSIEGEQALDGWTIRLYRVLDDVWTLYGSDETENGGEYEFSNLPGGTYKVCEVMKPDWTQTFVSNGSLNESPNVSEEGPECRTVNIDKLEEENTVNFGNHYEETGVCEYGGEYPECNPEPQQCLNVLSDGSFEAPVVTDAKDWQRFATVGSWLIERLSDNTPTTLELHRDWKSNEAAQGEQYAELDGDWSTKISQSVMTYLDGAYELRWAYAPRHDITAEQNQLSVLINGVEVATEGPDTGISDMTSTDWKRSSHAFTADSATTTITFADAGPSNSYGTFIDDVQLCLTEKPEPCEPEKEVYADMVEGSDQGLTKGGAAVAGSRSNPDDATGDPDWSAGQSDGFYSLGFGGSIVVSFEKYVKNIEGDDISIHEATNGQYPLEVAKVEVSQTGEDDEWYALSELAQNDKDEGGDGVTLLDFDETGLTWIKYVRVTDMSDPSLHSNNADGFDLDTVDAAYVVCTEPEPKPQRCEIVSDTNTLVVENNELAVETYSSHPAWTAAIPGALWIWESFFVADPVNETMRTFTETFTVSDVATAQLEVAADNSYEIYINGVLVAEEVDEFNFRAEQLETYDVASYLQDGENTFVMKVTNWAQNNGSAQSNPAGALYKLTIDSKVACEVTTAPEEETEATLEITNPALPNLELPRENYSFTAEYNDDDEQVDTILWAIRAGTCDAGTNTVAGNVDGFTDSASFVGNQFSATVDITDWLAGEYCFVVNPQEQGGEDDLRATQLFTLGDVPDDQEEEQEEDPEEQEEETITQQRSSSASTGTRVRSLLTPAVLGAATSQCGPLINDYMKLGLLNTETEVYKLQAFLIVMGYEGVELSGTFDTATDAAVRVFQEDNRIDVLTPWETAGILSVSNPTGWVYQLTKWKINNLYCPGSEALPDLIP